VVTEVLDARDVAAVARVADVLQIGARNMHNVALLSEAGASGTPVLIKRGLSSTFDELLSAAEFAGYVRRVQAGVSPASGSRMIGSLWRRRCR
jgi:3-deoxy-D-arabino-heptulosonate 7-phosphate (DAHP) synthase